MYWNHWDYNDNPLNTEVIFFRVLIRIDCNVSWASVRFWSLWEQISSGASMFDSGSLLLLFSTLSQGAMGTKMACDGWLKTGWASVKGFW